MSPPSCATTSSVDWDSPSLDSRIKSDSVTVRFSHADGDANGVHKRCRIEVGLRPQRLDVEDTDVDLFAAVNHATDRASRSVARALEQGRP